MTTLLPYFERPEYLADASCKIALVGFGTVGSSVARLLYARGEEHSLQLTQINHSQIAVYRILSAACEIGGCKGIRLISVQLPRRVEEIRVISFSPSSLKNKLQDNNMFSNVEIRNQRESVRCSTRRLQKK